MMMLTNVNTKVHCSIVPPMFHLLEHTQVVDFKGFLTTFSINVPMFQYIYKGRRVAKYFTLLSDSGSLGRTSLVQTHKKGGTMEHADNEAPNYLISLAFRPFPPTGTCMEQTEQCLKIKQQRGKT